MTPNNQTGAINLIIGIVVAIALVLGGGYYVYEKTGGDVSINLPPILSYEADETPEVTPKDGPLGPDSQGPSSGEPVACTLEAKICPDGSAVGRTGPNCEFAACPVVEVSVPKTEQLEMTQEEKTAKLFEFLFPEGTTKEWRINNAINVMYPEGGLPKQGAYKVVDLVEEMIENPTIKRDQEDIYKIFMCADDHSPNNKITIDGIDYPLTKIEIIEHVVIDRDIERLGNYWEANSNISAGLSPNYSQEEACDRLFNN